MKTMTRTDLIVLGADVLCKDGSGADSVQMIYYLRSEIT